AQWPGLAGRRLGGPGPGVGPPPGRAGVLRLRRLRAGAGPAARLCRPLRLRPGLCRRPGVVRRAAARGRPALLGADAATGRGAGARGMTAERARLLYETHRRLAGGGVEWARRRDLAAIAVARLTWRGRVALAPRLKRAIDLVGGLALITLAAPILGAVALAIKLGDGGPSFFRQIPVGKYGRHFLMYKFRSMVTNAEALKAQLMAQNEMRDGILFKIKKDPRITRVGRLIRKLSLDELPQLF